MKYIQMPSKLSFQAEQTHKLGVISHLIVVAILCNTNGLWIRIYSFKHRRQILIDVMSSRKLNRNFLSIEYKTSLNLCKWLYSKCLFSWLKGVGFSIQSFGEKTVLFKENSSHLLITITEENHNIDLVHMFKCNETLSVLEQTL